MAVETQHDVTSISGAVTFETVATLLAELMPKVAKAQSVITVDLSQVDLVNSAALSLVASLTRHAKRQGKQLSFKNVPSRLIALSQVCGVEEILALK
jgi:anti-anti-sigma factor